jgi:hypothetical protein
MANELERKRPVGAKFSLLVVVGSVVAPSASAPLVGAVADVEMEEDAEGDGLGHTLLYTNCSGSPLQGVVDPASYVPFVYLQQVPGA